MGIIKYNTSPNIIQIKNKSLICLKLVFPCSYNDEDALKYLLLNRLINIYNLKYPKEEQMKQAATNNLIIDYSISTTYLNKNLYVIYNLTIPDPKKVKIFNLPKALLFFKNFIYYPNAKDGKFNLKQLKREKEYLIDGNNKTYQDIYDISYYNFLKYYDNEYYNNCVRNNFNKIKDVTPQNLYDLFAKMVLNNKPMMLIGGNISNKEITLIKNIFNINNEEHFLKINYYKYLKVNKELINVEDNSNFEQSILYLGYKVDQMHKKDIIYLKLLKEMLNSSSTDLLLKALRYEHNLVYSASVYGNNRKGSLIMQLSILNTNKELTISVINESLEKLKNPQLIKYNLNIILKNIKYSLIASKDNPISIKMNDYLNKKLKINNNLIGLYNDYKKIDIIKFIEFLNRLKLDTIYFYRGVK